jgi:hypothetical protein
MDAMRIPVAALEIAVPRLVTDFGAVARYSDVMGVVVSHGDVSICEGKSGEAISVRGTELERVSRRRFLVAESIV